MCMYIYIYICVCVCVGVCVSVYIGSRLSYLPTFYMNQPKKVI